MLYRAAAAPWKNKASVCWRGGTVMHKLEQTRALRVTRRYVEPRPAAEESRRGTSAASSGRRHRGTPLNKEREFGLWRMSRARCFSPELLIV